jgi:uncharacterized oxidoreductase
MPREIGSPDTAGVTGSIPYIWNWNESMELKNNTILITGGTSGIGIELARQLIALGNTVIVTGRDAGRLEKAKQTLPEVHTIQSDASKSDHIAGLFEQVTRDFPGMNILINNAGIMKTINLNKPSGAEDITAEIETNLNGPIRMIERFLPHLKTKPTAAIVNVTSGLAFVPLPTSPIYCATKAGLHSYTLSLRVQLKRSKVLVFELAPPATETPLLSEMTPEERKGISIMTVQDMVQVAVKGMEADTLEIRPGQSNQLKLMNRIAPGFIHKMLAKSVDRMLDS